MSKEPRRNVYVGHRYVPLIMDEWDKTISYEGLSIVTYKGGSYTSKKRVPVGIDIKDTEFWTMTGNYDAQVEGYRKEVMDMEKRVTDKMEEVTNDLNELNDNLNKKVIDLYDFGAYGDGVNDDSEALTNALNYLKDINGGTLNIHSGIFNINGYQRVYDNTHINLQSNAIIRPVEKGLKFIYVSTSKGYNGGVKNIKIDGGGVFDGSRYKPIGHSLHHVDGLTIKDVTVLMNHEVHFLDLCGCRNILLNNVSFFGNGGSEEKKYNETIQIDFSSINALSHYTEEDENNADGLPTINVTVENCRFLPLETGGISVKSGSPIGSHSQTELPYKNIKFINNTVTDSLSLESGSGIIHFRTVRELNVKDNIIKSNNNSSQVITVIDVIDDLPNTINNNNHSNDIVIENNHIEGFNGNEIIRVRGSIEDFRVNNITIKGNKVKIIGNEVDFLTGTQNKNITIIDNIVDGCEKFYEPVQGEYVYMINNIVSNIYNSFLHIGRSELRKHKKVVLKGNIINSPKKNGNFGYISSEVIEISNNTMEDDGTILYFARVFMFKEIFVSNNFYNVVRLSDEDRPRLLLADEYDNPKGAVINNYMTSAINPFNDIDGENDVIVKNNYSYMDIDIE